MHYEVIFIAVLVFAARTLDVSVGTLRIIMVSKGKSVLAAILGFFESLIWIFAIAQLISNLTNPLYYIAFASGFAFGTYVGVIVEQKIALGTLLVRIISDKDCSELINTLRAKGYGVTNLEAQGKNGFVNIFYTVIHRSANDDVLRTIKDFNPDIFFTVEEVKFASIPLAQVRKLFFLNNHFGLRKAK